MRRKVRTLLLLAILIGMLTTALKVFSSRKVVHLNTFHEDTPTSVVDHPKSDFSSRLANFPLKALRTVGSLELNRGTNHSQTMVLHPMLSTEQPKPDTTASSAEPSRTALLSMTTSAPTTVTVPTLMPYNKALSVRPGKLGVVNEGVRCCREVAGIALEEVCHSWTEDGSVPMETVQLHSNCSCLDFLYCKLVMVSGFSSNHYIEAQDMIATVQHYLPSTRIIVYDLGLTDNQRTELRKYCNVEVRAFQFSKYSDHVKKLTVFAWKPLIVNEIAEEYEVIFYGDSSTRVLGPVKPIFPLLLKFPFMAGSAYTELPIIAITMDETMRYLKYPYSRQRSGFFGNLEAGLWVMWMNHLMRRKLLKSWVDCALHKECIDPPGAVLEPCDYHAAWRHDGPGRFVGCHRFDQSALSLILIREFGLGVWNLAVHPERTSVFRAVREITHYHDIKQC